MANYEVSYTTVSIDGKKDTHTTTHLYYDTAEQDFRSMECVIRNLVYTGYYTYATISFTQDGKVNIELTYGEVE